MPHREAVVHEDTRNPTGQNVGRNLPKPEDLLQPATWRSLWDRMAAAVIFRSGALRLAERVARTREVRMGSGSRLPRLQKVSGPKFVILCYHRVGTSGVPLYSALPPSVFEAQMEFLSARYRIVSLEEVVNRLGDPTAEPGVAVTFDDGYGDVFQFAYPALRKYRIPATIFLTASAIETGEAPWYDGVFLALQVTELKTVELTLDRRVRYSLTSPPQKFRSALDIMMRLRKLPDGRRKECMAELERRIPIPREEMSGRMLTWDQVRSMQAGGISFGSHTMTHPVVSRLEMSELLAELRGSREILEEKIGTPVVDFAFPFGQASDCGTLCEPALAECGYRSAVTTVWGVNERGTSPFFLRRVQIGEERSLEMFALQLGKLFLRASEPASAIEDLGRVGATALAEKL